MIAAGGTLSWNSNVFNLPDTVDAQSRLGTDDKSDWIHSYYVGLRVDQPYANQRFLADATITAHRYNTFEHLDFDAKQYRLGWNWHLTPRITGTLSADRTESLVNYSDFRQFDVRNVRVNESRSLLADYWLWSGWHVVGGVSQRESKTSQPIADEGSFKSNGGELGVKYVTRAGNSVRATARHNDGNYTDRALDPTQFLGDGFERRELELAATWVLTGRSTLDARATRLQYDENQFSERDFDATALSLNWAWKPLGRLSFNAAASRNLSPWRDLSAKYKVDDQVSIGGSWQVAARTTVQASVSRGESEYREPFVPLASGPRRDDYAAGQVGVDWRVLRNLSATASLATQRRTSTDPGANYRSTLFTLGASIAF